MGMVYSKIAQGGGEKKDFSFLMKNVGFLIKTVPFAHKKAEEYFNIAIKTAGEIGAKSYLGQAYLELGQLHKAKGKTEKARECINHAIDAFEKCEADVFLKQAREALASPD
jgi:tetratricopeptide (TPR) repeat protein